MRHIISAILIGLLACNTAIAAGKLEYTPYTAPKTLYDFYFDDPEYINSALYWLRSQINPLMEEPYNIQPEDMKIVVVIHGTEIATIATKNYSKYQTAVDRMRYYASLGVDFRVCALAAEEYGYSVNDFQDFIKVVPSAMAELSYWQQQGYALITPRILIRQHSIESIR
ncbi:hypothetical protein CAP31_02710 [Sulfuriferula sp. AH1]|uniref:DsrE family protein n=1 Tax=Sulfuriferula sp. AH1 TaxID=1985873 RepID=UPI000B3B4450|nr:DsrE family protein [Sulfuriferula sp. AH1]ARU30692.1 hypothetical protein CAP31_02710 [Sulfuriferula sp. AH1]